MPKDYGWSNLWIIIWLLLEVPILTEDPNKETLNYKCICFLRVKASIKDWTMNGTI